MTMAELFKQEPRIMCAVSVAAFFLFTSVLLVVKITIDKSRNEARLDKRFHPGIEFPVTK